MEYWLVASCESGDVVLDIVNGAILGDNYQLRLVACVAQIFVGKAFREFCFSKDPLPS